MTQIYEFLFPNDGEAASAQATLADKIAVAEGTMRVAPGFRYGQAYLVVNLPDEADLVETLSPFIQGHWQIPGMRWEVELDKEATDEEVELTAQDIAEEEAYYAYWRYRVDGAEDIPEGEPIPPRGEEG